MTPGQASDRPTVAIVGLGNIGFRHLQGLKSVAGEIRLAGIDISADNLARAGAEWGDASAQFSTGDLPAGARADLLILATSSQGRLDLLRRWGDALRPRFVILEKVAFTRMADFDAAARWAREAGATIFVNCPRRMWPLFRDLRERLSGQPGTLQITCADPDLGLACNGVHIVDALQFLAGDADVRADSAVFDRIWDAKRPGYKEIYGAFGVVTASGHRLRLVVREGEPTGLPLEIRRGALDLRVDQGSGRISTADGAPVADLGRAPYQSELTGIAARELLREGRSSLPSLAESALAHRPLIEALERAFDDAGVDRSGGLPIT